MKKTSSPTSVTSTPIKGPIETSAKPFGGIVHSRRATASFNRFVTSPWLDLRQDRCASLPSHLQRSQHLGGNLMEIKFDFDTPISRALALPVQCCLSIVFYWELYRIQLNRFAVLAEIFP